MNGINRFILIQLEKVFLILKKSSEISDYKILQNFKIKIFTIVLFLNIFLYFRYVDFMYNIKHNRKDFEMNITCLTPKCPKQTNNYDCGIYLLYFAECFLNVCRKSVI